MEFEVSRSNLYFPSLTITEELRDFLRIKITNKKLTIIRQNCDLMHVCMISLNCIEVSRKLAVGRLTSGKIQQKNFL